MTDPNYTAPPAGWYPDPAGSSRTRWWNGFGWSDTFGEPLAPAPSPFTPVVPHPVVAQPAQPQPAQPQPAQPFAQQFSPQAQFSPQGFQAAPAYSAAPAYGAAPALTAPEGTSPYTWSIWILALLPLVTLASTALSIADIDTITTASLSNPDAPLMTTSGLLENAVTLLIFGVTVLLGVLDWRALRARGVPAPFHWAWIFFALVSAPVYMIGRSVIVRRRLGSGLAPMFVNLALFLVSIVVTIAVIVQLFVAVTANMPVS